MEKEWALMLEEALEKRRQKALEIANNT